MACPVWDGNDADEHRAPACFHGARQAIGRSTRDALARVPVREDLERWHRLLFHQVVPLSYYAGTCRCVDAATPCLDREVMVAGVAGTPAVHVRRALDQLFAQVRRHLNANELRWLQLSPEQRARGVALAVGTAVGAFIRIHPFLNGNGRTSRLLWRALLHRFGIPPQCAVVTRPLGTYGDVMAAAMVGDNGPLIAVILNGMGSRPLPESLPTQA